jgi:hypothetical protein
MYLMVVDDEGHVGHLITPGDEKEVMHKLETMNWSSLRRVVEEHS